MLTLDQRFEAYKTDGFTIFEKVFDEPQMQSWREKHAELSAANNGQTWFGNTLELAPELMWPPVSHPTILEFIEKVMGPFVQLDNLTLAAFPSMEKEKAEGRVSGWHRDRWAHVPYTDAYHRPNAINAISYLQDLTDEFGAPPCHHRFTSETNYNGRRTTWSPTSRRNTDPHESR